jgi:hypothetical protein
MAYHPLNLALHFLLELAALAAYVYWGWTQHEGVLRVLLAIGLPLVVAAVWGIFRVPGEPGDAPVAVSGPVRLLIEALVFGGAIVLLYAANAPSAAMIFAVIVILHYITSYDRVLTRLSNK